MMSKRRENAVIKAAVLRFRDEELKRYGGYPDSNVEFSREFEHSINGLISESNRRIRISFKRKIIVIVTVTLLIAALSVTVFANYGKIIRYIFERRDDHTVIIYPDEDSMTMNGEPVTPSNGGNSGKTEEDTPEKEPLAEIEVYYTLSDLPVGYGQIMRSLGLVMSMQVWQNAAADAETGMDMKIVMTQSVTHNLESFVSNNGTLTEKHVAGHDGYWIASPTYQIFGWRKGDYAFKVQCPISFSEEELYDLVNSVEPIEEGN